MTLPDMKKFNKIYPLSIQQYERYIPTAFDNSLTILEKLNKIIEFCNQVGALTNEVVEQWNNVMEWIINEGLQEAVLDQLNIWLNDGTIEQLINEEIFNDLNTMINQNKSDIEMIQNEITNINNELNTTNQNVSDIRVDLDNLTSQVESIITQLNDIMQTIERSKQASQNAVYQKKLMEPYFGFNGDEIFPGGQYAPQGMAYVRFNGQEKVFILSRVQGSAWSSEERQRITEFNLSEDGSEVQPVSFSQILNLSHQGLSAIVENDQIILYAGMNSGANTEAAKGFSKIVWNGYATSDDHVTSFQVIGSVSSGHELSGFHKGTPTVSTDGKYIVMTTHTDFDTNQRYCFVYDRLQVETSPNPLNVKPLTMFPLKSSRWVSSHVVQDLACDGRYIYIFASGVEPKKAKVVYIYTLNGSLITYFPVDGAIGDHTDQELNGNTSLGIPTQIEAEGIAIRDNNNLLVLTTDVWESGSNYTRRSKVIHELTTENDGNVQPTNRGYINIPPQSGLHLYGQVIDITVPAGEFLQFKDYNEETATYKNMLTIGHDRIRLFDRDDTADNEKYGAMFVNKKGDRDYLGLRADAMLNEKGAGANFYGRNDSVNPGAVILYSPTPDGSIVYNVRLENTGNFRPGRDGVQNLGSPSYRFDNVYATGNLTTSDRNMKADIEPIPDDVLDAWSEVNYVQFKYKESIERKGDQARKHIGVIAQEIYDTFKRHGLNALEYGIVGYDMIEKDNGQTEKRWFINPNECQFLELALMRREIRRMQN